KTATSLLNEYKSLDGIYKNIAKIPSRFQTKLVEGRENAYLSQKLATIVTNVPITLNLEACESPRLTPPLNWDRPTVVELFRTLEFRSLLAKPPQVEAPVTDKDSARDAAPQMALFGPDALDTSKLDSPLPRQSGPSKPQITRPIIISDA